MVERALIVLGLLLLAACGQQQAPALRVLDQQQYTAALHEQYKAFQWPADRRPDLAVLAERSGPGDAKIQAGGETVVLEIANSCAWYLTWDAARARGDAEAERLAFKVIDEVLPTYTPQDPAGQKYARDTAVKAKAGDKSMVDDFVAANCDTVRWL